MYHTQTKNSPTGTPIADQFTHNSSGATAGGLTGQRQHDVENNLSGTNNSTHGNTSSSNTGSNATKPSLMDKLNPKVDANGDGKAGFMK